MTRNAGHPTNPDAEADLRAGLSAEENAALDALTAAGAVGVMDVTAEPDAEAVADTEAEADLGL